MTEQQAETSAVVEMTAAEFAIARESLGVSEQWLADHLGVALRTVQRWGKGQSRIPGFALEQLQALLEQTDDFIDAVVAELQDNPVSDELGQQWVVTYPSETVYQRHHPDTPWPASWHRAAMGRAVEQVDDVRVRYLEAEE